MRAFLYKQWLVVLRKFKKIARSRGSAHSIALGAAIGFLVGMEPIMGIQMVVAAFIATIFNANRISAILPVWITNPATFIPVYGFNYWIGYKITGFGPGIEEYEKVLAQSMKIADESGFFSGIVDGSKHLASMGTDALLNLLIGCTVAGLVCAAIAYPLSLWIVNTMRTRRERRKAQRHERVQKVLGDQKSTIE